MYTLELFCQSIVMMCMLIFNNSLHSNKIIIFCFFDIAAMLFLKLGTPKHRTVNVVL